MARDLLPAVRRARQHRSIARAIFAHLPGPQPPEVVRQLDPALLETLGPHGVLTALAPAVLSAPSLDPEVKRILRQAAAMGMIRAEQNRRSWDAALDALARAQVEVLPLKGRSLATRLYGSPAQRISGDVDLLVPDARYETARDALRDAGYRHPPSVDEAYYRREHHHLYLEGPAGSSPVELHFKLISAIGRGIPSDQLIARTHLEQMGGRSIRVMAPEDELVYLCVHAAVHGFTPMQLLVDLHLLADKGLDWSLACARARAWHVEVAFAVAIAVCAHWTGMVHPPLELRARSKLRARAAAQAFCGPLLLSALFGEPQLKISWLTHPVLIDRPGEAAGRTAKNLLRVAKRRVQKRWPEVVPKGWGG